MKNQLFLFAAILALAGVFSCSPDQSEKPNVVLIFLDDSGWSDFARFALNQDTGGAITGPGRADLFWGNGNYAEIAAGHLKYPGNLYFLVLKPIKP